jgi:undecaprenyl-diphosphatase
MDLTIVHALNRLLIHHDWIEDVLAWYASASQVLFIVALVGLLLWRGTRVAAIIAAIATPAALGAVLVISALFPRARPFVSHPDIHRFIAHASDSGFPSDHAAASFAIATALLLRVPRVGAPLLAAAVLLAVSRVAVGVHWPTDVLAGAAVGAIAGIGASWAWEQVNLPLPQWVRPAPLD